ERPSRRRAQTGQQSSCRCRMFHPSRVRLCRKMFGCSLCSFLWFIDVRSFEHAIFEMRDSRAADHANWLKLHFAAIDIVEEARAATEEKRNEVNLQFVYEACREVLLCEIRAPAKRHC